jgi:hypothetical protein
MTGPIGNGIILFNESIVVNSLLVTSKLNDKTFLGSGFL